MKPSAQALRGMEADDARLYRALFEESINGEVILDDRGIILEANPAVCVLSGCPRERLVGMSIYEAKTPIDVAAKWSELLTRGHLHAEVPIVHGDGEPRLIELFARKNVLPGRHVVIVRDVTKRQHAEDALKRSEERFSQSFHASPIAMAIRRRSDDKYIEVNQRFVEVLGFRRDEVLGHDVHALGVWPQPGELERFNEELRARGSVHELAAHTRVKSGAIRDMLVSAEPIDVSGEPCLLDIIEDVTERNALQARLMFSDRMVSIGTLAAGVAHEINNPLAVVKLNLDLLAELPLPDDARTLVADARDFLDRVPNLRLEQPIDKNQILALLRERIAR
jgi:PAS domain S-box-containing protein